MIVALLIWVLLVLLPILVNWSRYCFNNYDLGIYSQALARISWNDPNPWISVRQIRIFNDHFDPVLFFFAPFTRWVDPSLMAIVAESAFVVVTAIVIHRIAGRPMSVLFLFSKATTSALTFPVHPATWSVLPLVCLLHYLRKRAVFPSLLSGFALLWFKEEYVYVVGALGVWSIWAGRREPLKGTGTGLLAIAGMWGLLVFWLRPLMSGETVGYGSRFIFEWMQAPTAMMSSRLLDVGVWRGLLEILLPFVPLFPALRRTLTSVSAPWIVAFGVLFSIRLVSGRWAHHYWIPLVACLALAIPRDIRISRRLIGASAILLMLVQLPFFGRYSVKTLFRGGLPHCPAEEGRRADIVRVREILNAGGLESKAPITATGYLIPRFIGDGGSELIQAEMEDPMPRDAFWLITEVHSSSIIWPGGRENLEAKLERIRHARGSELLHAGSWIRLERIGPEERAGDTQ